MRIRFHLLFLIILLSFMGSCSSTKYVSKGEYLLTKVKIEVEDEKQIKSSQLTPFVRQKPNHKTFGLVGFPLFFYNLSGRDTSIFYNRWLRNAGDPPVIFDSTLMVRSSYEMTKFLENKGYLHANVTGSVNLNARKKKAVVTYVAHPKAPYFIQSIQYNISNDTIKELILKDSTKLLLRRGILLDRSILEQERQRISTLLRNDGYYAYNKEYVNFTADTINGERGVDITLNLGYMPMAKNSSEMTFNPNIPYRINQVFFVTNYNPMMITDDQRVQISDTVKYGKYYVLYGKKRFINPSILVNSCYLEPGTIFRLKDVENTYSAFSRLRILKYVNIRFDPIAVDGEQRLNCTILLTEGKSQSFSAELEGTNSAGDLGFATGLTYQHRNIFRNAETFTAKGRLAYETLSGNIGDIINDNYTEVGLETSLSYPQFLFPFLSSNVRKKLKASTEFALNINYQQRPEYTRYIAGGGWRYKWTTSQQKTRHNLDLIDISYIYLPATSNDFLDQIGNENQLLRYSYEDHFIMRMGYMFYKSNLRPGKKLGDVYTLRAAGEMAGNLLYGISSLSNASKGKAGEYSIFGIRFAQYAKADIDYAYTFLLSPRNSFTLHAGAGIAVPYGNSQILPFEKRYFSGGANSVRGWNVRTLGPGAYKGSNALNDFMNQCGDIRLDLNAEYRANIFWKIELATFIDAGNIWTINPYSAQKGGAFHFDTFAKQIALSYGIGLRLDLSFFVLRLDLGIKAYDPAAPQDKRWVIANQNLRRDAVLHFAVGYPF